MTVLFLLDNASRGSIGGRIPINIDLNIVDSEGQSPLWLALLSKDLGIAKLLIDSGAYVDQETSEKDTLLHRTLVRKDADACLFLLQNGADFNKRYLIT